MADDVRIATGLRHHRKTKRLRRALGAEGCWSLVCLFLWAGDERWTGDLSGLTDADIEEDADWHGEPGALIAALLEVKFMVGTAGHRQIHDWQEHNPYAASKGARIAKGRAASEARWEKERQRQADADSRKASSGADGDVTSMQPACPEHATRTREHSPPAPAPAPAPTPTAITPILLETPAALPRAGCESSIVGAFEGHPDRPAAPNPVAPFAIALNSAGFRCTPMNPDLIAFATAGGTVEHLQACAASPECAGKPAAYVIRFARRELAEQAAPIAKGATHETTRRLSASERVMANIARAQAEDAAAAGVIEGEFRAIHR